MHKEDWQVGKNWAVESKKNQKPQTKKCLKLQSHVEPKRELEVLKFNTAQ